MISIASALMFCGLLRHNNDTPSSWSVSPSPSRTQEKLHAAPHAPTRPQHAAARAVAAPCPARFPAVPHGPRTLHALHVRPTPTVPGKALSLFSSFFTLSFSHPQVVNVFNIVWSVCRALCARARV